MSYFTTDLHRKPNRTNGFSKPNRTWKIHSAHPYLTDLWMECTIHIVVGAALQTHDDGSHQLHFVVVVLDRPTVSEWVEFKWVEFNVVTYSTCIRPFWGRLASQIIGEGCRPVTDEAGYCTKYRGYHTTTSLAMQPIMYIRWSEGVDRSCIGAELEKCSPCWLQ